MASQAFRRFGGIVGSLTGIGTASSPAAATMSSTTEKLTPVYFVSHGGVRATSRILSIIEWGC